MHAMSRRLVAALVCTAVLGACGGTTARGTILHAPKVPALAYPRIAVVSGHLEHEREAARIVADALDETDSRIWLLTASDFEGRESPVPLGPGTAVLLVTGDVGQQMRTHVSGEPVACVLGGLLLLLFSGGQASTRCDDVELLGEHPTSSGAIGLLLWDGETGRFTHREVVSRAARGTNEPEMRTRMGAALGRDLARLLAVRVEREHVHLRSVPHPDAERALAAIDAGQWERGRALLERARETASQHDLDEQQRADLLYDLAQATRFARVAPSGSDLEHARALLGQARALDDDDEYADALERLRHQSEAIERIQDFHAARRRRFGPGR